MGFSIKEQDRKYMTNVTVRYVRANIVAVESSKYYIFRECVFVTLGIQHAMRMRHIVICSFSRSTIFFHIISYKAKKIIECKMFVLISLQILPETFSFSEQLNEVRLIMHIGLHVKCPLFLSDFNETCNFAIVYRKTHNIKFHENPSSGTNRKI